MLGSEEQTKLLVDTFKKGIQLSYKRGEYVIRPGETPGAVFYIESGLVKAFDITKYGEENLLSIRKAHEIFPLIWAITGQDRSVIYQVMSPSVLWKISRKEYLDFIHNHPYALAPILDITIEMYRLHSERIMGLEYRTVRERLVAFIILLSKRFGAPVDKGVSLNVPMRQQDLASSINASRETTGRELGLLEKKGYISVEKSIICINDIEKLESYLK